MVLSMHLAHPTQPSQGSPARYKSIAMEVPLDRAERSSFSSIREDDSDLAQTFVRSKVSSHSTLADEVAIEDHPAPSSDNMVETHFRPPVTRPQSKLHGYWYPADSFKGWKQIDVRGKLASKSFGDLQVLNLAWNITPAPPRRPGVSAPGQAPLEKLPVEILTSIIELLMSDVPPRGFTRRNADLMSLLLTSKTLHSATLNSLYSRVTIPHSRIFLKFLTHVSEYPALGTIVRRLDFCHFNPSQLFSTASERSQARNLTSETLLRCLDLTPNLQEFLGQEYIDDDLDASVLRKLLFQLPRMQALDLCACSSAAFRESFNKALSEPLPDSLSITRLSLHKCMTLPSTVFETLLPRLGKLTHLDVAGTRITDAALASIPTTARITHLNLAKCSQLSAPAVIDFVTTHPAVANTLQFLSLATDARSYQLLGVEELTELLPKLPKTLKSLSLKGSKMESSHMSLLLPLTKYLEELSLGRGLSVEDVNSLFIPDDVEGDQMQMDWVPHTLKYLDLSDLWGNELDLSELFDSSCVILRPFSEPLAVVEVAEDASRRLGKSQSVLQRAGWQATECGSRVWLVRTPAAGADATRDDGRRPWKMGAESWGMRKIPVAKAEVGGMYGSYMFSRKL